MKSFEKTNDYQLIWESFLAEKIDPDVSYEPLDDYMYHKEEGDRFFKQMRGGKIDQHPQDPNFPIYMQMPPIFWKADSQGNTFKSTDDLKIASPNTEGFWVPVRFPHNQGFVGYLNTQDAGARQEREKIAPPGSQMSDIKPGSMLRR